MGGERHGGRAAHPFDERGNQTIGSYLWRRCDGDHAALRVLCREKAMERADALPGSADAEALRVLVKVVFASYVTLAVGSRHGFPVLRLSPDCAGALLATEPPRGDPPAGPFPAFGVALDCPLDIGVAHLYSFAVEWSPGDEFHGSLYFEAEVRGDRQRLRRGELPGVPQRQGPIVRPGASSLVAWEDGSPASGPLEAARTLALNLLHLLGTPALHTQEQTYTAPKSPKKLAKAQRAGRTFRPATVVSLTAPIRARMREAAEPTGRTITAHIRRGHWHRFWVADPAGRRVYGERQGPKRTLYLVANWIPPMSVGAGEPGRRNYRVTL